MAESNGSDTRLKFQFLTVLPDSNLQTLAQQPLAYFECDTDEGVKRVDVRCATIAQLQKLEQELGDGALGVDIQQRIVKDAALCLQVAKYALGDALPESMYSVDTCPWALLPVLKEACMAFLAGAAFTVIRTPTHTLRDEEKTAV